MAPIKIIDKNRNKLLKQLKLERVESEECSENSEETVPISDDSSLNENIFFLRSILTQLKNLPYESYKSGIEKINWDEVRISNGSIVKSINHLQLLLNKVKKHRTLREVIIAYIKEIEKQSQHEAANKNPPADPPANPPTRPATRFQTRIGDTGPEDVRHAYESKTKSVRNRNSHGMCEESAVTSNSDIIERETIDKKTRGKRKTVESEAKVTGGNGRKKSKTEPQVDVVDKNNLKRKKQPMKGKAVQKKKFVNSNDFSVCDD